MFRMSISEVAEAIVRQELLKRNNPVDHTGTALHIHFDVKMSDYDTDTFVANTIHLLYHQSVPGSGWIDVFSGITGRCAPANALHEVEWSHETSHDCGRSDLRVFNNAFYQMEREINANRTKAGLEKRRPCDIFQFAGFGVFSQAYEYVPVKGVTKKYLDDIHYKKVIELSK